VVSKVAIVEFNGDLQRSLKQALKLIGNIDDLNTKKRTVVIKVGVFNHKAETHSTVNVVNAIANSFNQAPRIFLAESDNYKGTGTERLQIWKKLFTERVVPFNLSEDANTRKVKITDEEIGFSHILFKPNVFVSTHVLRTFEKGSILKNLLGLIPDAKKARFHKKLETALLDAYEAIGGIDLAVLDGTYTYRGAGANPHIGPDSTRYRIETNILLVGRDAVAVEAVGAALVGLDPEKMPLIQEAMNRHLGEGDVEKIEIVGTSFESLKEKFASVSKTQKESRTRRRGPQTWGGHAYHALESLIQEGFFRLPNKRTREDVAKALEGRAISTKGKEGRIANSLSRRVKKGVLKAAKSPDGWVYWTE